MTIRMQTKRDAKCIDYRVFVDDVEVWARAYYFTGRRCDLPRCRILAREQEKIATEYHRRELGIFDRLPDSEPKTRWRVVPSVELDPKRGLRATDYIDKPSTKKDRR